MNALLRCSRSCRKPSASRPTQRLSAVIRKALALANVARQHAGSDNTITITSDEGKPPVKVSLAG
jgi:hypothetical protein